MATNIPDEAISIHNDMVDELSVSMTDKEFKKLKRLLEDVPLTASDKRKIKSVQKLFSCLIDKTFIFYGDYEKLKPKLTLVKPSLCTIVQRHAEAIEKILRPEPGLERFAHEDITIMMYDTVYKTWEGSQAAFVDCKVDPLPDRIVWKRDKTIPLRKKVLSDNHKYYYSPQTPTLVIRDPKKSMDEAQYQCWAEAKGANADGDIVQLQVAVPETIKSIATTSIPGPSEDFSSTTINIPPESSEESDKELESSIHDITIGLETLPRHRKRTRRQSDDQPYGKRVIIDKGCRIIFDVTNEIDITRQETENDIIDGFERATGVSGRVDKAKLKPKCIQVCIDISAAKHPSEPSSIHLAEEFRHYLLDGETIQLSDESQTVLQIDETSFQITPHSLPDDGTPYVKISHGEFTVPVGKTVILQTNIIASTEAIFIQWFKLENGHYIAIEIDNQRYYGGSDMCPTLIIRETTIADQGQYTCLATDSKGISSSDTSSLYIVSDGERIEDVQESPNVTTKGHDTCTNHKGNLLDLHCEDCEVAVCIKCVSEKHQNHSISDGTTHAMKQNIIQFIQETEGKEIISIKQDIIATGKQLEENTSHFQKLAQQLKVQSKQLLQEIRLQSAQMLTLYNKQEDDNSKLLQTYKKDLEIYETQLNEKVKKCKRALDLGSEKDIHDVGYEIKSPASRPVKPSLNTPSANPEEQKKTLIKKSFEDVSFLSSSSEREKGTIDEPSDVYTLLPGLKMLEECRIPYEVDFICPNTNGETWICDGNHTLTLLDKTGTTKQTISHTTWIRDICLSPTTNMLWACDGTGGILELESGRLVRRFGMRKKPQCICSTASNHVIVGTNDLITKYTPEGSQVLTSLASSDNGEPIVRCPGKISECLVTHNVAVTDNGLTDYGRCVIVFDEFFRKLFVIDGKVSLTPVHPWNALFDNIGNLVILDSFNNNILLFNGRGKQLRTLRTDKTYLSDIGIDKDNILWVMQRNKLSLVQYYSDV
ncbi:uncharacterized protein [Argopecten irradians]|uniref:uncharacterized protein n=1 Tax=Argopecten irradians TaxID=31199 RepID=UPI003722F567